MWLVNLQMWKSLTPYVVLCGRRPAVGAFRDSGREGPSVLSTGHLLLRVRARWLTALLLLGGCPHGGDSGRVYRGSPHPRSGCSQPDRNPRTQYHSIVCAGMLTSGTAFQTRVPKQRIRDQKPFLFSQEHWYYSLRGGRARGQV